MNAFFRHLPVRRRSLGEGGSLVLGLARFSVRGGGRLDRCQNVWLIAKIFRSHFFDVVKGDGVHVMLESFIEIEAEAVKLVERAVITESIVALIGDLLLANDFLLGAL